MLSGNQPDNSQEKNRKWKTYEEEQEGYTADRRPERDYHKEINRRKIVAQGICIIAIVLIFTGMNGLNRFIGSKLFGFLLTLAIQILLLVFCIGYEKRSCIKYILVSLLFLISCCITYDGLAQICYKSIFISNEIQKNLNEADSDCCNAIREFTDLQIEQRSDISESFLGELNALMESGDSKISAADDSAEPEIYFYENMLRNKLSGAGTEDEVQKALDGIYQEMENSEISAGEEIFSEYHKFRDSTLELFQLLKIREDILELYREERTSGRTRVRDEIWIKRLETITGCKKRLEAFGAAQDENIVSAVGNLEEIIQIYITDNSKLGQYIGLLFHMDYPYWSQFFVCMAVALILNVLELLLIIHVRWRTDPCEQNRKGR